MAEDLGAPRCPGFGDTPQRTPSPLGGRVACRSAWGSEARSCEVLWRVGRDFVL